MAVAPALAVSGAALGGAVRAPRPTGGGEWRRVSERPSPSLVVGRRCPFLPRSAAVGSSGRRRAVRARPRPGWWWFPRARTTASHDTSSADSAQFQSDELEVPGITEDHIESSDTTLGASEADTEALNREVLGSALQEKPRVVPPPGNGQKIFEMDSMLHGYKYPSSTGIASIGESVQTLTSMKEAWKPSPVVMRSLVLIGVLKVSPIEDGLLEHILQHWWVTSTTGTQMRTA